MSNEPLPLITSFVIRFIHEDVAERAADAPWRCVIRHVQTDQERTFTQWQDALNFMQEFLPQKVFEQT